MSSDGRLALLNKSDRVHVWDMDRARRLADFPCLGNQAIFLGDGTGIVFRTDTNRLALSRLTSIVGIDSISKELSEPETLDDGPFVEADLNLCSSGHLVAYQSSRGVISVVDPQSNHVFVHDVDANVSSQSLSQDGKLLAIAMESRNQVDVVSTLSEQVIAVIRTSHPKFVSFSPNGEYLAISDGGSTELRKRPDWQSATKVGTTQYHSDVAFSADSRWLAIVTHHDEISLFPVDEKRSVKVVAVREDEDVAGLKFSADGRKMLATTSSGLLYYWDLSRIDELLANNGFHQRLGAPRIEKFDNLPIYFSAEWIK